MEAPEIPPQLDVEFLQQAIYNPKDRLFVLKVEQQMRQLLQKASLSQNDQSESLKLKFPPMNSYQRMIVHKVADYFQLGHVADASEQSVCVYPLELSKIPEKSLAVAIADNDTEEQVVASVPARKIIQRRPQNHNGACSSASEKLENGNNISLHQEHTTSLEQREAEYQRLRAALFQKEDDEQMDRIVNIENTFSIGATVGQIVESTVNTAAPLPAEKRQLNPFAREFLPTGNFDFNMGNGNEIKK